MPTPTEQYQATKARLDQLRQRRAVLDAEETKRMRAREELSQALKTAGVDLGDLPGEKERLRAEIERLQAESVGLVDEFERKLDEAERGEPGAATQEVGPTTQTVGESPAGADVEID